MKIGSLIFATSNPGKIKEAQEILGVKVNGTSLEIEEIQSLDPLKVALAKARAYFDALKEPLFVEDTSLSFEGLNGLPGPYISDMAKALGNEGLAKLIKGKSRKAQAQVTLVFVDSKGKEHSFIGVTEGSIAASPRGEGGFGWDPIFQPIGWSKTFGEMTLEEKNEISMRKIAFQKLKDYLS